MIVFFEKKIEGLTVALEESVKWQRHYAEFLNANDGGERIIFKSAEEWIECLREIGKIPKKQEVKSYGKGIESRRNYWSAWARN